MLSHLKPIQVEMLEFFKSHINRGGNIASIYKTELQSTFSDIPISVVFYYMEELEKQNFIKIDWKQCDFAHIMIIIKIRTNTLEALQNYSWIKKE